MEQKNGIPPGLRVEVKDPFDHYARRVSRVGLGLDELSDDELANELDTHPLAYGKLAEACVNRIRWLTRQLKVAQNRYPGIPTTINVDAERVWEWAARMRPEAGLEELIDSCKGMLPHAFLEDKRKAGLPEQRGEVVTGIDWTKIGDVCGAPDMTSAMYAILADRTDHNWGLVQQLFRSRGVSIAPKYEVEQAYGCIYLLNHYAKDPVNWSENAHAELRAFEKAKLEAWRERGDTLDPKYIVYEENKQ